MAGVKVYTERTVTYLSKAQKKKLLATCAKIKIDKSVYIRKATMHCLKNEIIKQLNGD